MILFKKEFIPKILDGTKTQTRRLGKKRWNVGSIYQCKCSWFGKPFAKVEILSVQQEVLDNISENDARAEGFKNRHLFFLRFWAISKVSDFSELRECKVWVIKFRLCNYPELSQYVR